MRQGDKRELINELNSGTELNADGNIAFTAHDDRDLFYLLADGITYPDSITRMDASAISHRSFLDLRKSGEVSRKPLISEIASRVGALESAPRRKYTMWTKCRLRSMTFAKTVRFDVKGVAIRTSRHLPKWLQLSEHFISGIGRVRPNALPFYGYLIFSVEARNENEASTKIFAAADLLFAIANTSKRSLELWTQRVPSAFLWLGPHQFFFEDRRFIGDDHVWYNQNFDEDIWNRFPKDARDFVHGAPFIRRIVRKLADHPLCAQLESSLLLINEGMTSVDLSFRLMRFWSAAEALYAPSDDRTSANRLISRLTFASGPNEWLDKIKLERCYHLRNLYVHRGSNDSDDTSLVQHLRELLLRQIYYYLFNGDDFESHTDLLMMVDLPTGEQTLLRRKLAIDRRLSFARCGRHRP